MTELRDSNSPGGVTPWTGVRFLPNSTCAVFLYETVKRQDIARSRTRECPDYLNGADMRIEVSHDKRIMSIRADEGISIDGDVAGDETCQSCSGGC
jgi:hypothetical protein